MILGSPRERSGLRMKVCLESEVLLLPLLVEKKTV